MAETEADLVTLTAEVAAAYFDNNSVEIDDIGRVISGIHQALSAIGNPPVEEAASYEKQTPAQIRKSIAPDHLVSFIDGEPIYSIKSFNDYMRKTKPKTTVRLEVRRGDNLVTIDLPLEEWPKGLLPTLPTPKNIDPPK